MKKTLESIVSFILTVLTTIVIILAALGVIGYMKGWRLFNIETGSMNPAIPPGTLIIIKPVEPAELKPGDVVTYVFNDRGDVVTHRLVSIDPQNHTFITRGDANNTDDAPENTANIIGKVVFTIPKIGPFASLLSNPDNRPYLISLIAVLVGVSLLMDVFISIKESRRKEKEEKQQSPSQSVQSEMEETAQKDAKERHMQDEKAEDE